jgi:hypothetical protein
MLIVIGKMAYVRDFISSMTVMTLMTIICGLILERVMNSIRNGLGMRETEIAREPS